MSRGRVDVRQLKRLRDDIARLEAGQWKQGAEGIAQECGKRLLRKVKKRTPVGVVPDGISEETKETCWGGYTGGTLRDKWEIAPFTWDGDCVVLTILNNAEYASYVEYGHRQAARRYVPAIEKRLKRSWVPGRFMLKKSVEEMEGQLPAIAQKELDKILKEVF